MSSGSRVKKLSDSDSGIVSIKGTCFTNREDDTVYWSTYQYSGTISIKRLFMFGDCGDGVTELESLMRIVTRFQMMVFLVLQQSAKKASHSRIEADNVDFGLVAIEAHYELFIVSFASARSVLSSINKMLEKLCLKTYHILYVDKTMRDKTIG
ncbi:Uncharacterized protein Rs2_42638 [Raphanus sativus]|nr:Uncharacterized protein Rs2_42638 [Raphanus sativus]